MMKQRGMLVGIVKSKGDKKVKGIVFSIPVIIIPFIAIYYLFIAGNDLECFEIYGRWTTFHESGYHVVFDFAEEGRQVTVYHYSMFQPRGSQWTHFSDLTWLIGPSRAATRVHNPFGFMNHEEGIRLLAYEGTFAILRNDRIRLSFGARHAFHAFRRNQPGFYEHILNIELDENILLLSLGRHTLSLIRESAFD